MKNNFKEQFINLRKIIQTNVLTLNDLITQSEQLSQIIHALGNEKSDLKKQLEETRRKISESIEVLVDQTGKLFDSYDRLVEEVFGKQ